MRHVAITKVPGRQDIELTEFYKEFEWYYTYCELETKNWVVNHAQSDWTYIDCGANIGYYSILFSQLSPEGRVHAIEPTSTVEMLKTNLAHNLCDNVRVHNLAVGEYPGKRKDKIFRIWGDEAEQMECDFASIDSFVKEQNIERLDCIKIDVDSFDFEVLKGAEASLENYDPWIIIELSNNLAIRGSSVPEALLWLKSRGYKTAEILDGENYIFKRQKVHKKNDKSEIPIDVVIWLQEKDILFDVATDLVINPSGLEWTENSFAIKSLVSSIKYSGMIKEFTLMKATSPQAPVWQYFQFSAFANEFKADCILEFGRWGGDSTFALLKGVAGTGNTKIWSICESEMYMSNPEYEKYIRSLNSSGNTIEFVHGIPEVSGLREILADMKRVLVIWNDTSEETRRTVLGCVLPLIQQKKHAVVLPNISDGRYKTMPEYNNEDNLLVLENLRSSRIDFPHILDFLNRNRLHLLSPEQAFKRIVEAKMELRDEFKKAFGTLYAPTSGWCWFTLNGHDLTVCFPESTAT